MRFSLIIINFINFHLKYSFAIIIIIIDSIKFDYLISIIKIIKFTY